jgi:hypothetical protein
VRQHIGALASTLHISRGLLGGYSHDRMHDLDTGRSAATEFVGHFQQ